MKQQHLIDEKGKPAFVTTKQAAEIIGVSVRTLETRIKEGTVPYYRFGPRVRMFRVEELVNAIERTRVASREEILS